MTPFLRSCRPPLAGFFLSAVAAVALGDTVSGRFLRSLAQEAVAEPEGEPVHCGLGPSDRKKLLLLTSSGLGVWGPNNTLVTNANLTDALHDLVLHLPDEAWDQNGRTIKADAWLRANYGANVYDAALFGGLDVVVIEDACFLKESFWNEANPNFDVKSGIGLNYQKAHMSTNVSVMRPFFGQGLDGGWCVNFASDKPGFLPSLGFSPERIRHLSLWDRLADDYAKTSMLELVAGGGQSAWARHLAANLDPARTAEVSRILASSDVLVVNGGNPDFLTYVLTVFGEALMAPVVRRIEEGSVVYMGQSAGSMAASADAGLTYETTPSILNAFLGRNTTGLGLAGRCAIRPHDDGRTWDITSAVYGALKNLTVVRVANGDALRCSDQACQIVGATSRSAPSVFSGSADPHLERLTDAFLQAVQS